MDTELAGKDDAKQSKTSVSWFRAKDVTADGTAAVTADNMQMTLINADARGANVNLYSRDINSAMLPSLINNISTIKQTLRHTFKSDTTKTSEM